jgi:hypothetical protein
MPTYVVRPGLRHGAAGQYGPGDKVELSVGEASGFLDKLELVTADDGLSTIDDGDIDSDLVLTPDNPWRGLDAKVVTLLEAGEVTPAMVATLSDEELLSVEGIGAASLKKIRSAFGGDAGCCDRGDR